MPQRMDVIRACETVLVEEFEDATGTGLIQIASGDGIEHNLEAIADAIGLDIDENEETQTIEVEIPAFNAYHNKEYIPLNSIEVPKSWGDISPEGEHEQDITALIQDANPSIAKANWTWRFYDGDSQEPYVIYLE